MKLVKIKPTTRRYVLALFLVWAAVIALLSSCSSPRSNAAEAAYEIQFSQAMDITLSKDTKITYDEESLNTEISKEKVYIYANPKETDFKIVSKLGFDVNAFTEDDEWPLRWYRKGSATLEIDQYGCFSYASGAADTTFEFPFGDEEAISIAENFLKENGLYTDGFTFAAFGDTTLSDFVTTEVVSRMVYFVQTMDEKPVGGNQRIGVELNGNGEVVYVNYNVRQYQSKAKVESISVKDAMERIREGKATVDIPFSAKELKFENVSICYYTDNLNYENIAMQPVFIFTGTCVGESGKEEPFDVTVQANPLA